MNENKRRITVLIIIIIALFLVFLLGLTYSYLFDFDFKDGKINAKVSLASSYKFSTTPIDNVELSITSDEMSQASASVTPLKTDNASFSLSLASSSDKMTTTCTYDIVWVWDSEEIYTAPDVPTLAYTYTDGSVYNYEFSAKVDGGSESDLSKLKTNDKKITLKTGETIEAFNTTPVVKTHNITANIYKLPVEQPNIVGKNFKAHIIADNLQCNMQSLSLELELGITPTYNGTHGVPVSVGPLGNAECSGGTANYNQKYNQLEISNLNGNRASCALTYANTTNKENFATKIKNLVGNGQVYKDVIEGIPEFTPTNKLERINYDNNLVNDANYPWNWNETDKSWTSSNKTDTAKSTTSSITFNPPANGPYQICYKQDTAGEKNYDYGIIYLDDVSKISLQGNVYSDYTCTVLGELTTSSKIKVEYKKDSTGNAGEDQVSFYIQAGFFPDIPVFNTGYRYQGKDVNNYVWFNNELWRIIGVLGEESHGIVGQELVKIMRDDSLWRIVFDKNGGNVWETSSLNALLNGAYLNRENGNITAADYCYNYKKTTVGYCDYSENGISNGYRSMVKSVYWNVGGVDELLTIKEMYIAEKAKRTTETSKIGLLNISDFALAGSESNSSCQRTNKISSYGACHESTWLYKKMPATGREEPIGWMIMPYGTQYVPRIINYLEGDSIYTGTPSYIDTSSYTSNSSAFRPVLYLDAGVYTYAGSGTKDDPYIIGM